MRHILGGATGVEGSQARDILLLLMSLARRSGTELVTAAFSAHAGESPPGVEQELRRLARFVRPLTGWFGRYLHRIGNRDMTGLLVALSVIGAALPTNKPQH